MSLCAACDRLEKRVALLVTELGVVVRSVWLYFPLSNLIVQNGPSILMILMNNIVKMPPSTNVAVHKRRENGVRCCSTICFWDQLNRRAGVLEDKHYNIVQQSSSKISSGSVEKSVQWKNWTLYYSYYSSTISALVCRRLLNRLIKLF